MNKTGFKLYDNSKFEYLEVFKENDIHIYIPYNQHYLLKDKKEEKKIFDEQNKFKYPYLYNEDLDNSKSFNSFINLWAQIKHSNKFLNIYFNFSDKKTKIFNLYISDYKINYFDLKNQISLGFPKILENDNFNKFLETYLESYGVTKNNLKKFYDLSIEKDKEIYNIWLKSSLDNWNNILK